MTFSSIIKNQINPAIKIFFSKTWISSDDNRSGFCVWHHKIMWYNVLHAKPFCIFLYRFDSRSDFCASSFDRNCLPVFVLDFSSYCFVFFQHEKGLPKTFRIFQMAFEFRLQACLFRRTACDSFWWKGTFAERAQVSFYIEPPFPFWPHGRVPGYGRWIHGFRFKRRKFQDSACPPSYETELLHFFKARRR